MLSQREERDRLCHLLRFATPEINPARAPLMPLKSVAKILGVSIVTVHNILKSGPPLHSETASKDRRKPSKLKYVHRSFLLSDETLMQWAHKSLDERCILFHRKFPEVKISPSYLSILYRKHGISRKRIVFVKKQKPHMMK